MKKQSQKEKFIREIEGRIISGKLRCGEQLPTERSLVEELNMSRTVIHTGLAELAALGFITIKPRKGYIVNDYLTEGSMAVLESIMHYNKGEIAPELLKGLLQSRRLVETETAALAAVNRSDDDFGRLEEIISGERLSVVGENRAELDFQFHHAVAVASGNPFYPLILKSFEPIQKRLIHNFYASLANPSATLIMHEKLLDAIKEKDAAQSVAIMTEILDHGETVLKKAVE